MQVTQEVLQRGVVGIRQLVDALVQPDVPQAVIFNFCIAIGHAACQFFRAQRSMGKRPHALAASIKPWCRVFVSSGSGSSRSHIFRTLVTLFISPAHSGASKSTASMSIFESTKYKLTGKEMEIVRQSASAGPVKRASGNAPFSSLVRRFATLLVVPLTR